MIATTKPINVEQLQNEMKAAGVDVGAGLGMFGTFIFPYIGATPTVAVGGMAAEPGEFTDPIAAQKCIDAHVAA